MTLTFPTSQKQILDRMIADAQSILPDLNPALKESFIRSLLTALAGAGFEQYLTMQALLNELFIDTASGQYLERWGSYKNISRSIATFATGKITATGSVGALIPVGSLLETADGVQYETDSDVSVSELLLSITSLTRSGSTVTAITASDHNLASGIVVTISGANQSAYNGSFTVQIVGTNSFTYSVSGSPTSPATGSINLSVNIASIPIYATKTGIEANQLSGVALEFVTPITDIDQTAYVQFSQLSVGSLESDTIFAVIALSAVPVRFPTNALAVTLCSVRAPAYTHEINSDIKT